MTGNDRLTHGRANGPGYWSGCRKDELIQRLDKYEDLMRTPQELLLFIVQDRTDLLFEYEALSRYTTWHKVLTDVDGRIMADLPEKDIFAQVLVTGRHKNVEFVYSPAFAQYWAEDGSWTLTDYPDWENGFTVTHWMEAVPLPDDVQQHLDKILRREGSV